MLLPIYLNFLVIAIFGLIIPITHILNYGISSLPIIGVLITLFFIYNFYKRNFDKVIYLKIILFFTVINFTLPQTYSNTNNDYTSLNSLENEIQNLKLYSDYKITADLIWNLKRKVKKTELSKINDSIFVLISNKNYDSINYEFRENRLIIDKKIKVDFNPTTEDSNRYRDRLATNLYVLSKI